MARILKFLALAACLAGLLAAASLAALHIYASRPVRPGAEPRTVVIAEGSPLGGIAETLQREGIIRHPRLFLLLVRLQGSDRRIKAGEYRLSASHSPREILHTLVQGRVATHAVTIPEGYTCRQIAELLARRGLAEPEEFLRITADPQTAKRYGIRAPGLEGFLYPDTYHISRGLAPENLVDILVRRFWEMVRPLEAAIQASGMSLEEVVTLASIVEKETGLAAERPLIASVFLNRLRRSMRLESDPTVIYGIQDFDGNLTREHLRRPTPYNTYVIAGLPPGPIANPGLDAIRAVLFPARTDYLFFVSRNDGSHQFSKTLAEHNRAVNRFQRRSRSKAKKTS